MSRNQNSHFSLAPQVSINRSSFKRPQSVKFTFNVGEIVPFYIDEVLPGDTMQVKTSKVIRLQTPITPFMDNLYIDFYEFFIPKRLLWDHWKEFNGENTQSAWYPSVEYQIPQIEAPSGGWNVGTIADYLGVPTGVDGLSVSALPFRAYALVMNEWFRDENLSDPLSIPKNDTTVTGVNTGNFVSDVAKGGLPYTAAKYHDYFTSALPAPQKGPDVVLPSELGAKYPVVTGPDHSGYGIENSVIVPNNPEKFPTPTTAVARNQAFVNTGFGTTGYVFGIASKDGAPEGYGTYDQLGWSQTSNGSTAYVGWPANLWADTSYGASFATTINQLRLAFQIQKLYERDARGGTRYTEILKSHFGVTSPDSRLQRPEYLGGNRVPINVNQVVQNSETASTPQGTTAAYSLTTDSHGDFIRSFTEHGYILGVCVARYDHTYQQGLERMWSRKDRFDFYWPALANIGEQAILNKEIYAQGTSQDDEVFGYQEAWAEYRCPKPNRVAGEMRSSATTSLDVWHLADDYASLPQLGDAWIREDKSNVDRVLAVTSSVSNQLLADIYIQNKSTRPMPVYSIPGLIDHH